jgi:hypothetical protein
VYGSRSTRWGWGYSFWGCDVSFIFVLHAKSLAFFVGCWVWPARTLVTIGLKFLIRTCCGLFLGSTGSMWCLQGPDSISFSVSNNNMEECAAVSAGTAEAEIATTQPSAQSGVCMPCSCRDACSHAQVNALQ